MASKVEDLYEQAMSPDQAERRERELAAGKSEWLPGEEVMRELRQRYGE